MSTEYAIQEIKNGIKKMQRKSDMKMFFFIIVGVAALVGITVFIIMKLKDRKNNDFYDDYDYDDFDDYDDYDDYDDDYVIISPEDAEKMENEENK